ncbi:MAG: hypothetical protein U0736_14040 [Gemmataceae bacterium]
MCAAAGRRGALPVAGRTVPQRPAQRCGETFAGIRLAVWFDVSASVHHRDRSGRLLSGPDDLALDHAERYAFENADFQYADTGYACEQVRRLGWTAAPSAVLPADGPLPLVSVCVPYYNLGRHLPETLASLRRRPTRRSRCW